MTDNNPGNFDNTGSTGGTGGAGGAGGGGNRPPNDPMSVKGMLNPEDGSSNKRKRGLNTYSGNDVPSATRSFESFQRQTLANRSTPNVVPQNTTNLPSISSLGFEAFQRPSSGITRGNLNVPNLTDLGLRNSPASNFGQTSGPPSHYVSPYPSVAPVTSTTSVAPVASTTSVAPNVPQALLINQQGLPIDTNGNVVPVGQNGQPLPRAPIGGYNVGPYQPLGD